MWSSQVGPYWREASHRPLQGIPPDAPFHLPDPALPLSWPFAYAPPIETLTAPSRPMLPVTSAPTAEILPSEIVRVERVSGSQLPLLVTTVTLQSPSYGVCAIRGATEVARVTAETKNKEPMRLTRMSSFLDLYDDGLSGHIVSKMCCTAVARKFMMNQGVGQGKPGRFSPNRGLFGLERSADRRYYLAPTAWVPLLRIVRLAVLRASYC
jgi:hypothetical protein